MPTRSATSVRVPAAREFMSLSVSADSRGSLRGFQAIVASSWRGRTDRIGRKPCARYASAAVLVTASYSRDGPWQTRIGPACRRSEPLGWNGRYSDVGPAAPAKPRRRLNVWRHTPIFPAGQLCDLSLPAVDTRG